MEYDESEFEFVFPAELSEAEKVMPLIKLAHKESAFSHLPFEQDVYLDVCKYIVEKPSVYGGVYYMHNGAPVAAALFMLRALMNSSVQNVTMMHTIYVRRDFRATKIGGFMWERMINTARAWGIPRASRGIMFNVTSGIAVDYSDSIIRASGGTFLGGNYFLKA